MYRSVVYYALILVLSFTALASAESLWAPTSAGLFADRKARNVGDLVTVIISESTASSQKTSSSYEKSTDHSNNAGVGPVINLIPSVKFNSGQKGSAGGETTMTNNFVTRITATVSKVLPNGNFEITAKKSVITNAEKQDATLTAIVRPDDITSDNTVLSAYLAEVDIKYTGKGPAGDRQKPGIVSNILKFIF